MNHLQIGNEIDYIRKIWEQGMRNAKMGFVLCGKAIHEGKQIKIWKHLGCRNFREYCDKELHISEAQADRLAQVYREVGHLLETIDIEISKITLLLPYLKDKSDEEKTELLEMASPLTIEALKNNLCDMDGDGGKATDVCLHDGDKIQYYKCVNCGKFLKSL